MKRNIFTIFIILITIRVFSQLAITIPTDFEKSESLLISWSYDPTIDSLESSIIDIAKQHANIGIIYNPDSINFDTTAIRSFLQTMGADSSNIDFIPAFTNTFLLGQYAPVVGYGVFTDTLERYFGDPGFDSYSRPLDDSLPLQLADLWLWNTADYELQFEANNILYDGLRYIFVGNRILSENPDMTQNDIRFKLFGYYNSGECLFLPNPQFSGGGELNSLENYMVVTDPETILLSSVPDTLPDHGTIEEIYNELSSVNAYFGEGYDIHRILAAPGPDGEYATDISGENRSYTNSIIINDVVIVPAYGYADLDNEAILKYSELMPGYRIESLNAEALSAAHSGLHTITKVIPQTHYLRIIHQKITGLQPYTPFVKVNCLCQSDNYVEEMWLYYKTNDDTAYTVKEIQLVCPQHFAVIEKLNPGDTISYYIEAISATTTTTYPLSAPEGNFTFWLDITSNYLHNDEQTITIAPNPGNGIFKVVSDRTTSINIEIFNNLGQAIYSTKTTTNNTLDLSGILAPGYYSIIIASGEKKYSHKYLIQ